MFASFEGATEVGAEEEGSADWSERESGGPFPGNCRGAGPTALDTPKKALALAFGCGGIGAARAGRPIVGSKCE